MIHCLLVGGPLHGKAGWYSFGVSLGYTDGNNVRHDYRGENYLHEGRLYRILRCDDTPEQMAEVPRLIDDYRMRADA